MSARTLGKIAAALLEAPDTVRIGGCDGAQFPFTVRDLNRHPPVVREMARAMVTMRHSRTAGEAETMWDALGVGAQRRWLQRADAAWRAAQAHRLDPRGKPIVRVRAGRRS